MLSYAGNGNNHINNKTIESSSSSSFHHQNRRSRKKRRRRWNFVTTFIVGGSFLIIILVLISAFQTNGYVGNGLLLESSSTSTTKTKTTTIIPKEEKKKEQESNYDVNNVNNNNNIDNVDGTAHTTIPPSTSTTTTKRKRYSSKHQLLLLDDDEDDEGECPKSSSSNSKTTFMKNHRWSNFNKQQPKSKIHSLFNCDLADSICKYYYPSNFLHPHCGLGKEFFYNIEISQKLQANNTLWNNQQSIGFPTLTMNEMCYIIDDNNATTKKTMMKKFIRSSSPATKMKSDKMILKYIGETTQQQQQSSSTTSTTTKIRCLTERLSFVHVHKAGGSSLQSAYHTISRNRHHAMMSYHTFFIPPSSVIKQKKKQNKSSNNNNNNTIMMEGYKNSALHSLHEVTKYPSQNMFTSQQHVMFTVVRDPTERFISSIGQALGGIGSIGNKVGSTLKKQCLKTTSKETLNCLAKYIQNNNYWMEIHFLPQVLDIGFTTMWQEDIPIAVFPMKHGLSKILEYLGVGGSSGNNVHVRDGTKSNYRSDPILTNMTVDDYDEETLNIVCNIYEMDVRMQRSLGIDVPRCDPYIPNNYDFILE